MPSAAAKRRGDLHHMHAEQDSHTLHEHEQKGPWPMRILKPLSWCVLGVILGAVAVWWLFPRYGLPLLGTASQGRSIGAVVAHPLFDKAYMCSEHPAGQLSLLGDDLGQDCLIMEFVTWGERTWLESHRTDGIANQDWFGWDAPVLSPCECTVVSTHVNGKINRPGRPDQSRASSITLRQKDGTYFTLAHLGSFSVAPGAQVRYGQPIGRVGNNGYSRAPHVHVAAWRGRHGLQIRWDQQYIIR